MEYFRIDNTEGYTQKQLDELNHRANNILNDDSDFNEIKNVCERIQKTYDNKHVNNTIHYRQVYRGFIDNEFPNTIYFFSTNYTHATEYGKNICKYEISFSRLFDSLNINDIKCLIDVVGPLDDPYDSSLYNAAITFIQTHGSDTWEPIEQYLYTIKNMGFDAIRIFEGGYENYIIFSRDQIKKL